MIIQQELDDVRHRVVSAFMIAFPTVFEKKDMMIAYGGTKEKLVWDIFHRKLLVHYYSYLRVGEYYGTKALFQYRPLDFNEVDGSTTTHTAPSDTSAGSQGSDSVGSEFSEAYVTQCDEHGRIPESDKFLLNRALDFFLPVLRSRADKSKESVEKMCGLLNTWRDELRINERTLRDVSARKEVLVRVFGVRYSYSRQSSHEQDNTTSWSELRADRNRDDRSSGPRSGREQSANHDRISQPVAHHVRDSSGSGASHFRMLAFDDGRSCKFRHL